MNSLIKIGTTQGGILSLNLLQAPVADPSKYKFYEGAKRRKAASGKELWAGLPWADLYWSIFEQTMRDQLRIFCPGASSAIFVQLPTNNTYSTVATFSGTMVWPEEEIEEYLKSYAFRLKFTQLVAVS